MAFSILSLDGSFDPVTAWASAALLRVDWPLPLGVLASRWEIGPSIRALVEGPFQRGDDEFEFRYSILMAHDRAYKANERRVRFGGYMMKSAIAFFVLSLLSLGVGVLRYDGSMSNADKPQAEIPASQAEQGQGAGSSQSAPPLPTVEPVRPTYAERGQNYHFETRVAGDAGTGSMALEREMDDGLDSRLRSAGPDDGEARRFQRCVSRNCRTSASPRRSAKRRPSARRDLVHAKKPWFLAEVAFAEANEVMTVQISSGHEIPKGTGWLQSQRDPPIETLHRHHFRQGGRGFLAARTVRCESEHCDVSQGHLGVSLIHRNLQQKGEDCG